MVESSGTAVPNELLWGDFKPQQQAKDALNGAFFWLSAFYLVYCSRPEDWIPGLKYLPLAKITAFCALVSLLMSMGRAKRKMKHLPREAHYLLIIIALMTVGAFLSPVWRGGAVLHTLDFAKVYVAWVLTYLLVTTFPQLRRIVYIQAASVAVVCAISIIKGRGTPRLQGVLNGIYSNPNDLAFAIVLSLPLCLAFMLTTKSMAKKALWAVAMFVMMVALFMTASRAGFIDLMISGAVCLWHFGIKGRRPMLLVAVVVGGGLLALVAGGHLKNRFMAIGGEPNADDQAAYGSFEERKELMILSLQGIARYPVLGVGNHNFETYGGLWKEVHNAYLQIAVEGGVPVLILYLLFFGRAFSNLRFLRRRKDLEPQMVVFVGALHSSLVGFVVGALFAPEAYQFFPYFAVAQTSVLLAMMREKDQEAGVPAIEQKKSLHLYSGADNSDDVASSIYSVR